jgi:hypothetical protein
MNSYLKSAFATATGVVLAATLIVGSASAKGREFVQTANGNFAIAVADYTTQNPPRGAIELVWGDTWRGELELSPLGRIVYYTHGYERHTLLCDVEDGADEARVWVTIDMNGLAEIRC